MVSQSDMHGPELTYKKEAFDTNWMSLLVKYHEFEKL
jgi:hypothetical protein